jgi:MEDS: MEthanogen/methylotroph, DcmR Sensory domain
MSRPVTVQERLAGLQWGDHVCHWFRSAEELGEVLIPYFKTGLERDEACLWVTNNPYGSDRAVSEMRAAMPSFDPRMAAGQIEIASHEEWYTNQGALSGAGIIQSWMQRKDRAIASGYKGLRITGNTSFLDEGTWNDFLAYERALDVGLRGQPILALCSYCNGACSGSALVDVMCSHGASLAKRHGRWDLLDFNRRQQETDGHLESTQPVWSGLRGIVQERLDAHVAANPHCITVEGNEAQVSKRQATTIAIVLDELVANALAYGALSSAQGKITVQWRLSVNGLRRSYFKWSESGMSNVPIPEKPGTGTRLIAGLVENYVRVFEPGGMTCTFELDLGAIGDG